MNVEQIKVKPLQWFEDKHGNFYAQGFEGNRYSFSDQDIYIHGNVNGVLSASSRDSAIEDLKNRFDNENGNFVRYCLERMSKALEWAENPEAIQQPDAPLMQKLGRMEAVLDELHFPVEARNVVETILVTGHQIGLDLTVLNLRDEVAGFVHNGIKVEVGKSGAVYKYGSLTDEEGTLFHDPRNPDHAKTLPLVWRAFL